MNGVGTVMRRELVLSSILFMSTVLFSSGETAVRMKANPVFPEDNYVLGWVKSERTLSFEKSNLFDYIDGGAELFLELGFDELLVQRYKKHSVEGDEEIALEIYRMESSESALGIYLTKCGKETPVKGIKARNSGDRYQFSIVKGDCLVQVNNFSGDEKLTQVMVTLAQRTLASISKGHSVKLLDRLPKANFVAGSGLIIRGPYSLQSIFTFGRGDVLQLGGKVFGVTGDYVGANGDIYTMILIFYPGAKASSSAYDNLVNNLDPYSKVVNRWENGFTFKDYRDRFGIVELKDGTMKIRINLAEQPDAK
jgi:hypothetical protein